MIIVSIFSQPVLSLIVFSIWHQFEATWTFTLCSLSIWDPEVLANSLKREPFDFQQNMKIFYWQLFFALLRLTLGTGIQILKRGKCSSIEWPKATFICQKMTKSYVILPKISTKSCVILPKISTKSFICLPKKTLLRLCWNCLIKAFQFWFKVLAFFRKVQYFNKYLCQKEGDEFSKRNISQRERTKKNI